MKTFDTPVLKPIEFSIDGDVFHASPVCPAGTLVDITSVVNAESQGEQLNAVMDFLDQVLVPDSAELFAERLRSAERAISIQQATEVFQFLLESYNKGFPTTEPSQSASGSTTTKRTSGARSSSSRAGTRSVETVTSEAV